MHVLAPVLSYHGVLAPDHPQPGVRSHLLDVAALVRESASVAAHVPPRAPPALRAPSSAMSSTEKQNSPPSVLFSTTLFMTSCKSPRYTRTSHAVMRSNGQNPNRRRWNIDRARTCE